MVHQHFMLADNLTVLENIVLGSEPRKRRPARPGEARRRIDEISDDYGLDVEPGRAWSRSSASATGSGSRSSRCSTAAPRS